MTIPVTIDGSDIPLDAPRSQGMDDATAQLVSEKANEFRDLVMHLHADIVGRDVTLTAANCPEGEILIGFGDGSYEVSARVDQGATPEVSHTYLDDGVYTATLRHSNRERAFLQLPINWPPPPPDWMTGGITP